MPKLLKTILSISAFLILSATILSAEQLTITTYYPSPYGVYRELRSQRLAVGETYIKGDDYTWEESVGDGGEIDFNADLVVEGNVGIGTVTPEARLSVKGELLLGEKSIAGYTGLPFSFGHEKNALWVGDYNGNVADDYGIIYGQQTGKVYRLNILSGDNRNTGDPTEYDEIFIGNVDHASSTKEGMIIKSGNVGIGTTGPNEKLEIAASTGGRFIVSDNAGAERRVILLQAPTATQDYGRLSVYKYGTGAGGKNLILQDAGGNVGIGTTSPQAKLHVGGTVGIDGIMFPDNTLQTTAGGWHHDGSQVFNATAPTAWGTSGIIDLSSYVGINRALVFLKVKGATGEAQFFFRENGETDDLGYGTSTTYDAGCTHGRIGPNMFIYVILETDSNGKIQFRCSTATNTNIWLKGWVK